MDSKHLFMWYHKNVVVGDNTIDLSRFPITMSPVALGIPVFFVAFF